jgi:hypothetical protein
MAASCLCPQAVRRLREGPLHGVIDMQRGGVLRQSLNGSTLPATVHLLEFGLGPINGIAVRVADCLTCAKLPLNRRV